eukprot:gene31877-41363_t
MDDGLMDTALDTAVRRENILASQKNILADKRKFISGYLKNGHNIMHYGMTNMTEIQMMETTTGGVDHNLICEEIVAGVDDNEDIDHIDLTENRSIETRIFSMNERSGNNNVGNDESTVQDKYDSQIQLLKSREFSSRPDITHEIALWQGRLHPPKYLVGFNRNNCSTRHTLVCPDKNCGFNISIQYTTRNRVGSWKIGNHPDFVEQLYHKVECSAQGKVRIRVAADILKEKGDFNLSGRALINKSNELGFFLGASGGSAASRIKKEIEFPKTDRKRRVTISTPTSIRAAKADRPAKRKGKYDSVDMENTGDEVGTVTIDSDGTDINCRPIPSHTREHSTETAECNDTDNVELIRELSQELSRVREELQHLRQENAALRALLSNNPVRVTALQECGQREEESTS